MSVSDKTMIGSDSSGSDFGYQKADKSDDEPGTSTSKPLNIAAKKKKGGGKSRSGKDSVVINKLEMMEGRLYVMERDIKELHSMVKELRDVLPRVRTIGPTDHMQEVVRGYNPTDYYMP